jgi:chromosome segregation ATPase
MLISLHSEMLAKLETLKAQVEALEREKQVSAMEYLALEGQCCEHLGKMEAMRKDAERLDWLLEKCDDVDICSGLSFLFQDYTNIKDGIDAAINGEQA